MSDFEEMRNAYMRALSPDYKDIKDENEKLKVELHALQQRHERVLSALQASIERVLRVAREGKTET